MHLCRLEAGSATTTLVAFAVPTRRADLDMGKTCPAVRTQGLAPYLMEGIAKILRDL